MPRSAPNGCGRIFERMRGRSQWEIGEDVGGFAFLWPRRYGQKITAGFSDKRISSQTIPPG